MGNYIVYRSSKTRTGKVLLLDGTVHEFKHPITVAELMLDHQQQVVVELQNNGSKRATPLPADEKLDMKKVYAMLPMKRGGTSSNNTSSILTSEDERRILMSTNVVLKSGCFLRSLMVFSLFEKISPAIDGPSGTCLVETNEERVKTDLFREILEERPEYLSRQFSGKGWKPSLEPITERKVEKKVSHCLF